MTDAQAMRAVAERPRPTSAHDRSAPEPIPQPARAGALGRLVGWCITHRRRVFVAWVAVAALTTAIAAVVGHQYATNFTLPGTESQRARDLLAQQFPSLSGDIDTIVYRVSAGTVEDPRVRTAITELLTKVEADPDVVGTVSPYSRRGSVQLSRDRQTAFAVVNYNKPANLLPTAVAKPVLAQVEKIGRAHV